MLHLLITIAAAAFLYQLLAIAAALRQMRSHEPRARALPGISILKPVHGLDPRFYEAIRSHALQNYPAFEILFGVSDASDPAIGEIERLAAEFPRLVIRLIKSSRERPNRKVGVLEDLAAEARYSLLVVNDSDIHVPADYLRRIVAPLEDPEVGLVTCLYRAASQHAPGRLEAIGVATDFVPSVLVAPLVGVTEFGLGSTLAFRAEQLRQIGGFAAIAGYLADDYQLARSITQQGFRVHLSSVVVETTLPGETWRDMWNHQVRWHRTIRISKGKSYLGIPITQAVLWGLLAAVKGLWWLALPLLAVRMAAGLTAGLGVLRCPLVARYFYLIPLRDLLGVAIWFAGLLGNTVVWRDLRLRLSSDGRIVATEPR